MSRSKVKGQGHNGQIFSAFQMHCNALAADNVAADGTIPSLPGVIRVHRQRGRSVVYVATCMRFMFGKTSLALVIISYWAKKVTDRAGVTNARPCLI